MYLWKSVINIYKARISNNMKYQAEPQPEIYGLRMFIADISIYFVGVYKPIIWNMHKYEYAININQYPAIVKYGNRKSSN
jgi:hypothetical protein